MRDGMVSFVIRGGHVGGRREVGGRWINFAVGSSLKEVYSRHIYLAVLY